MAKVLRFMFVGDVMGPPGQIVFSRWAQKLKEKSQNNNTGFQDIRD